MRKKRLFVVSYLFDLIQSTSLRPSCQSSTGSASQSHSGAGCWYCSASTTAAQTSALAVEALVRLSAMMLAKELHLGTWWTKILVSRKLDTMWSALIKTEADLSPLTERVSQPKTTLTVCCPHPR